jgi:hypothetical protein
VLVPGADAVGIQMPDPDVLDSEVSGTPATGSPVLDEPPAEPAAG